jgi:hypothetical protein
MQWSTLTHRQRGGLIGAGAALLCFLGYFVFLLKLFLFDGWTELVDNANSLPNILGWVGIYGFMALVMAGMIGMVALPILFGLGSLVGWVMDSFFRHH